MIIRVHKVGFNNGTWCLGESNIEKYELVCNKDLYCEDIKTSLVKNKSFIPSGTKIEKFTLDTNMFGVYISCRFNGEHYYLNPAYLTIKDKIGGENNG